MRSSSALKIDQNPKIPENPEPLQKWSFLPEIEPVAKTLNLIRVCMGTALFLSFVFSLFHPLVPSPVFRFAGIPISFLRIPEFLANPISTPSFAVIGIISSLAFIWGFGIAVCGISLIALHGLFNSEAVTFGWAPLIDPFLLGLVLASGKNFNPQWAERFLKTSASLIFAWVAWSQVMTTPWLDHEMMSRYLMRAPLNEFFPGARRFLPVMEIVGGFAWLMQMAAPLALWHKSVGKYWAALLIVLHGILEIFMPLPFWNVMAAISVIPFLPVEWLSFKKSDWLVQLPELKKAWTVFSFFIVTSVMLCTVFDRNIAEQFNIFEKIGSTKIEKTYEIATNPFVEMGNLILFNSIWKMYSPTWRHVVWVEWFAKNPDGTMTNLPQENFSPDYRMHRRTWAEALWTDFKKEKVFVGMLSGDEGRLQYGKYLCHLLAQSTGKAPVSVHAEIFSFNIRGPETPWSLKEQNYEKSERKPEINCD